MAADHGGFSHQPLPIDTSEFGPDEGECADADLEPGQVLLHWIANQQNVTEAITLTLTLDDGTSLSEDSYKWNTPGQVDGNVTHHFEFIVDGDVVIDDLDLSTGEGNVRLSHVCRGEGNGGEEGETLVLVKQDTDENTLDGVGFTLGDGSEMLTVDGMITFTDLAEGSFTLTETSNPDEDCETGGTLTVMVSAAGVITVTDDDDTDGLAIVSFDAVTNTLVLANDCEGEGGEEGETLVLVKQDTDENTLDGVGFTLGDGSEMLTVDGMITFTDLAEGSFTLTETSNPDEDCETGGTLTVMVSAAGVITVTEDDDTDGLAIVSFDAVTNTLVLANDCEGEGGVSPETESPEQGVRGTTGTPGGTVADTATRAGTSTVPVLPFMLLVLVGLGATAGLNVLAVRARR